MRIYNALLKNFYSLPAALLQKLYLDFEQYLMLPAGPKGALYAPPINDAENRMLIAALLNIRHYGEEDDPALDHDAGVILLDILSYILEGNKSSVRFKNETTRRMVMESSAEKLTFEQVKIPLPHLFVDMSTYTDEVIVPELDNAKVKYYIDGCSVRQSHEYILIKIYTSIYIEGRDVSRSPQNLFVEFNPALTLEEILAQYDQGIMTSQMPRMRFTGEEKLDHMAITTSISYALGTLAFMNYGRSQKGIMTVVNEKNAASAKKIPSSKKEIQKAVVQNRVYLLNAPNKERQEYEAGGRKQTKMTLVRGHFRAVRIGAMKDAEGNAIDKNDRDTSVKWIAPFWKNLDAEEKVQERSYVI
jgi:hypothetical protein